MVVKLEVGEAEKKVLRLMSSLQALCYCPAALHDTITSAAFVPKWHHEVSSIHIFVSIGDNHYSIQCILHY